MKDNSRIDEASEDEENAQEDLELHRQLSNEYCQTFDDAITVQTAPGLHDLVEATATPLVMDTLRPGIIRVAPQVPQNRTEDELRGKHHILRIITGFVVLLFAWSNAQQKPFPLA